MLSGYTSTETYNGLERRANSERRIGQDRRNLIRFESFGIDRREGDTRRKEELFWERVFKR